VEQTLIPDENTKSLGHASVVSHVHASSDEVMGWAVAAPQIEIPDACDRPPQHATQSETASNFFDVVFLSVVLVAYTPSLTALVAAPRTTTQTSGVGSGRFLLSCDDRAQGPDSGRLSISVRFPRAGADTAAVTERMRLGSINASTPQHVQGSQHRPTGPPILPFISIRAWSSYC
jgi:hypothetical protein